MVAENFKDWLKLNYQTENTIRDIESYMNHFFSLFSEYNQDNVNTYLTKRLDGGIKKSTFNKLIYVLGVYAKFLKINIEFPKAKKVDKRIKDYISLEELNEKVLSMTDLIYKDHVNCDMLIKFLFFTGLRAEETIQLKKSNIDFERNIIKVIDTKGKVDREVFSINDEFFLELKKFCDSTSRETVFDFSYYQVWYAVKKLETDFQLNKKVHPHFMRVSFAKHCVRLGINDSIIQKLLGHSDIQTTMLYSEPDSKMVEEACKRAKGTYVKN